jgi:hypothetical protein
MAMSQSKPNESDIFAANRNGSQRANPLELTQDVTFGYATVSLSSLPLGSINLTQLQYVGLITLPRGHDNIPFGIFIA